MNFFFQLPTFLGALSTGYSMGCLTGGGCTPWPYNFYGCNTPVHGSYSPSITFTANQEENDGLVSRVGARGPHTGKSATGVTCVPVHVRTTSNSNRSFGVKPDFSTGLNDYQYDHMQAVGLFASLPPYTWANSLGLTPDLDLFVDIGAFINKIK
jgi:hypothetical protein